MEVKIIILVIVFIAICLYIIYNFNRHYYHKETGKPYYLISKHKGIYELQDLDSWNIYFYDEITFNKYFEHIITHYK